MAKWAARRVARASPIDASYGGSFLQDATMIFPSCSLKIAATTLKRGQTVTSKLALREALDGGV